MCYNDSCVALTTGHECMHSAMYTCKCWSVTHSRHVQCHIRYAADNVRPGSSWLLRCDFSVDVQMMECACMWQLAYQQKTRVRFPLSRDAGLKIAQFGSVSVLGTCDVKLELAFMHSDPFVMWCQAALSCWGTHLLRQ